MTGIPDPFQGPCSSVRIPVTIRSVTYKPISFGIDTFILKALEPKWLTFTYYFLYVLHVESISPSLGLPLPVLSPSQYSFLNAKGQEEISQVRATNFEDSVSSTSATFKYRSRKLYSTLFLVYHLVSFFLALGKVCLLYRQCSREESRSDLPLFLPGIVHCCDLQNSMSCTLWNEWHLMVKML